MLIGFEVAGLITDAYTNASGTIDYKMVWIIPAAIAAVVFLVFALFFNEKREKSISVNA